MHTYVRRISQLGSVWFLPRHYTQEIDSTYKRKLFNEQVLEGVIKSKLIPLSSRQYSMVVYSSLANRNQQWDKKVFIFIYFSYQQLLCSPFSGVREQCNHTDSSPVMQMLIYQLLFFPTEKTPKGMAGFQIRLKLNRLETSLCVKVQKSITQSISMIEIADQKKQRLKICHRSA